MQNARISLFTMLRDVQSEPGMRMQLFPRVRMQAAIAPIKTRLFTQLFEGLQPAADGPLKVLEIGIGTGPNLSYLVQAAGAASHGLRPPAASTAPGSDGFSGMDDLGTGPQWSRDLEVVGIDPNRQMQAYAAQVRPGECARVMHNKHCCID